MGEEGSGGGRTVPPALQGVPPQVLEDYVRQRVQQQLRLLAVRFAQLAPPEVAGMLQKAMEGAVPLLPDCTAAATPRRPELQLVFRHVCSALGCPSEQHCPLCEHNPRRRCSSSDFGGKYVVNEKLLARCGAPVHVEAVERDTGALYQGALPGVELEVMVLDGTAYSARAAAAAATGAALCDEELARHPCVLLTNNAGRPLMISDKHSETGGRILLQSMAGRAELAGLAITDSGEALLSGKKPPFRLLVRARSSDGQPVLDILPGVSQPFLVATARSAEKAAIPHTADAVEKLNGIGSATAAKLRDRGVCTVGQFQELAHALRDTELKALLRLLNMPRANWDEAAAQAATAVQPDSRARVWVPPAGAAAAAVASALVAVGGSACDAGGGACGTARIAASGLALWFAAERGAVNLDRPQGLVQCVPGPTGGSRIIATPPAQQSPLQLEVMRLLQPLAQQAWWMPGHPGWGLLAGAAITTATAAVAACTAPLSYPAAAAAAAHQPQVAHLGEVAQPAGGALLQQAAAALMPPAVAPQWAATGGGGAGTVQQHELAPDPFGAVGSLPLPSTCIPAVAAPVAVTHCHRLPTVAAAAAGAGAVPGPRAAAPQAGASDGSAAGGCQCLPPDEVACAMLMSVDGIPSLTMLHTDSWEGVQLGGVPLAAAGAAAGNADADAGATRAADSVADGSAPAYRRIEGQPFGVCTVECAHNSSAAGQLHAGAQRQTVQAIPPGVPAAGVIGSWTSSDVALLQEVMGSLLSMTPSTAAADITATCSGAMGQGSGNCAMHASATPQEPAATLLGSTGHL